MRNTFIVLGGLVGFILTFPIVVVIGFENPLMILLAKYVLFCGNEGIGCGVIAWILSTFGLLTTIGCIIGWIVWRVRNK